MQELVEQKMAQARRVRAEAMEFLAVADRLEAEVQELLAKAATHPPAEPPCPHPKDALEDCSTMGKPQARCRHCGAIVPLSAPLGGGRGQSDH